MPTDVSLVSFPPTLHGKPHRQAHLFVGLIRKLVNNIAPKPAGTQEAWRGAVSAHVLTRLEEQALDGRPRLTLGTKDIELQTACDRLADGLRLLKAESNISGPFKSSEANEAGNVLGRALGKQNWDEVLVTSYLETKLGEANRRAVATIDSNKPLASPDVRMVEAYGSLARQVNYAELSKKEMRSLANVLAAADQNGTTPAKQLHEITSGIASVFRGNAAAWHPASTLLKGLENETAKLAAERAHAEMAAQTNRTADRTIKPQTTPAQDIRDLIARSSATAIPRPAGNQHHTGR